MNIYVYYVNEGGGCKPRQRNKRFVCPVYALLRTLVPCTYYTFRKQGSEWGAGVFGGSVDPERRKRERI